MRYLRNVALDVIIAAIAAAAFAGGWLSHQPAVPHQLSCRQWVEARDPALTSGQVIAVCG
jgi:hypothetical protein